MATKFDPNALHSPVVVRQFEKRAANAQLRVADTITAFAGSMRFVYIHAVLFAVWMLVFERSPWPTLTLVVSLEAIFLSTFVLISQNRADAKRQVVSDQQWQTVQEEDQQNRELLDLSNQILDLTKAVHAYARAAAEPGSAGGERRNATGKQP